MGDTGLRQVFFGGDTGSPFANRGDEPQADMGDIETSSGGAESEASPGRVADRPDSGDDGTAQANPAYEVQVDQDNGTDSSGDGCSQGAGRFALSFELINAQWSLDSGRTVDFRIIEEPGHDKVNPFKSYQRRRNGRVGAIFEAAIVQDGADIPVYAGQVQLAGWGDTSDKGQWVRFWLDEEADLHPFAGLTRRTAGIVGTCFAGVLALIDDMGGEVKGHGGVSVQLGTGSAKPRPLSSVAHVIVTSPRFIQWLNEKSDWTERLHKKGRQWDAETSRGYVKHVLGIESLRELDQVPGRAAAFHEQFRKPYAKWDGRE